MFFSISKTVGKEILSERALSYYIIVTPMKSSKRFKKFELYGTDYREKTVKAHTDHSGRVIMPADWVGKRVALILLE